MPSNGAMLDGEGLNADRSLASDRCALLALPERAVRAALESYASRNGTRGSDSALRDVEVVPVSATASVRVHKPRGLSERPPALLWIHGGGYVAGSAAMNDRAVRKMAAHLGAVAASVEYRLAPEHRYPAALDDCYAALQWLAARDDIDRRRILIAGKSGGGGLAAALTLRHMDAELVGLAGQILIYPMLDDRTVGDRPPPQREAGHRKTIRLAGAPTWVVNPARGI